MLFYEKIILNSSIYLIYTAHMSSSRKNKKSDNDRQFTAKDLKELADFTYRQLNDWDSKGLLPQNRKDKSNWRRFTPKEVFILMVCSELRSYSRAGSL